MVFSLRRRKIQRERDEQKKKKKRTIVMVGISKYFELDLWIHQSSLGAMHA